MLNFNKDEIKESLNINQIFDLIQDWGGEPELTSSGIVASTICHNPPGIGSRKLYYYENSNLFKCYTGCENDVFDIFELCIKVMNIQHNLQWELYTAVAYIANKFGFIQNNIFEEESQFKLDDWTALERYDRIKEISLTNQNVRLKTYDKDILKHFNYSLKIQPWLNEGISQDIINYAQIGFYPGGDQITIPHFDKQNNFVGLRGRTLCQEDAERFGKYRPLKINNILYSHPLGMNLYGLNWAQAIPKIKKAIILESEKSVLKYMSYFGIKNNIAVACCGSSISIFQIKLLLEAGAEEIIIAFDRQFQEIGDLEFKKLTKHLEKIYQKYNKYAIISFIFDKNKITNYKDAPIDCGKDIFLQLYQERIFL